MSSMPSRLSRSFPREARAESHAKRVATLIPLEESPQKQHHKQHQQPRPARHNSPAAAAAKATAAATRTAASATLSSREVPRSSSSYSMPDSSSTMPGSGATAGAGPAFAESGSRGPLKEEEVVERTRSGVGGELLVGPLGSASRGEGDQHDDERVPEEGEGAPPGLMPLGCGSRPAFGAVSPDSLPPAYTGASAGSATAGSINSGAASRMVQQHCCSPPSSPSPSPPLPSSSGGAAAATTVSPAPAAIDSSACAAVNGAASSGSAAAVAAAQDSKQAALKAMMLKAKMAADNIRLLLHAKVSWPSRARPIYRRDQQKGRGGMHRSKREDASQPTIRSQLCVRFQLLPPLSLGKSAFLRGQSLLLDYCVQTAVSQSIPLLCRKCKDLSETIMHTKGSLHFRTETSVMFLVPQSATLTRSRCSIYER